MGLNIGKKDNEKKSISYQLTEIAEKMCDGYCKWPEYYLAQYKDPEDAVQMMTSERCIECPMDMIV